MLYHTLMLWHINEPADFIIGWYLSLCILFNKFCKVILSFDGWYKSDEAETRVVVLILSLFFTVLPSNFLQSENSELLKNTSNFFWGHFLHQPPFSYVFIFKSVFLFLTWGVYRWVALI